MFYNNFKFNSDKIELFIFYVKYRFVFFFDFMNIGDFVILLFKFYMNIGVIFDNYMNFGEYIKNICRVVFYYIRNIVKIRKFLSYDIVKILMYVFVIFWIDLCNVFLFGLFNFFI